MKTLYKSEQSGRSMVEMLGVLAIIGVLSVGGIAGYSKAMAKFKTSKALDQVSTTVANVRTLYSGQPNYSGLTTEIAIKMGAIGAEMLSGQSPTSAKVAYNAFNGEVTISATTVSGRANAGFTLVFSGLSKEACVQMASSDWGSRSGRYRYCRYNRIGYAAFESGYRCRRLQPGRRRQQSYLGLLLIRRRKVFSKRRNYSSSFFVPLKTTC